MARGSQEVSEMITAAVAKATGGGKKNPFAHIDVDITRQGTQIILPDDPAPMSADEAIKRLQRKKEEEETDVAVHEVVMYFPYDGAIAFMRAMKHVYGWAEARPTPTFFGPKPPVFIDVPIGPHEHTQVIWGRFEVPGIEGYLTTEATHDSKGRWVFAIGGVVKRRHIPEIRKLAELTRQYAQQESIYRGKAIKLEVDSDGDLQQSPPEFLDLGGVPTSDLVYSRPVQAQIDANLFAPIEKTERCRRHGIPLKRGVLLAGPYGTGKTLCAFAAAKLCEENGWTFIMLNRVAGLHQALSVARQYQPCVVFAEDIDRAAAGTERTVSIDDILNTLDGVESKGTEIITVLTTNHLNVLTPAILRPGRLDAIIEVTPPDGPAAERLMRLYGRGLIPESEDLNDAGAELAGQIPAVIREVTERAKLNAIALSPDDDGNVVLTGEALADAARGMKAHMNLLAKPKEQVKTVAEELGDKFIQAMVVATGAPEPDATARLGALKATVTLGKDAQQRLQSIQQRLGA